MIHYDMRFQSGHPNQRISGELMSAGKHNELPVSRRELLKRSVTYGLSVGALSAFAGCSGRKSPAKKPNIILIVIDTLRADHLGCFGYHRNTSPNIDALAGESILFTKAICTAPWTTPSIASIMTSCYSSTLAMSGPPKAIPPQFPCLAEVLQQNGYMTFGLVSHLYVAGRLGFARGFGAFDESFMAGHHAVSSSSVTARGLRFLKQDHQKPFFAFLHYFDPHYNYILHSKHDFYPDYKGDVTSGEDIKSLRVRIDDLSEDDIRYLEALYDSEIAHTDEHVGRLLDAIKKLGLYDNSIIIITSDHGEELAERGHIGHRIKLYQEMIHVPLIIKPLGAQAKVVERYVSLLDLAPTILKCVNLSMPDGIEGVPIDLTMLDHFADRAVFSETNWSQYIDSVIFKNQKLIYYRKRDPDFERPLLKSPEQFYDLSNDPGERKVLTVEPVNIERSIRGLLLEWSNRISKNRAAGPRTNKPLFNEEEMKKLKSLGYVR